MTITVSSKNICVVAYLHYKVNLILELEGDELVAQAASFFTGGFETSSTTTTFALYELAKNPEIQTRLKNEIFQSMDKNDGKVTYDMVINASDT